MRSPFSSHVSVQNHWKTELVFFCHSDTMIFLMNKNGNLCLFLPVLKRWTMSISSIMKPWNIHCLTTLSLWNPFLELLENRTPVLLPYLFNYTSKKRRILVFAGFCKWLGLNNKFVILKIFSGTWKSRNDVTRKYLALILISV